MVRGKNEILKYLSNSFEIMILEAAFRNLTDTSNPIRFNNFAYVLRELVNKVLDRLAPNKKVIKAKWWDCPPGCKIPNKANKKQQIRYALLDGNPDDFVIHKLGIDVDEIAEYVNRSIDRLNKYTHISSKYFGCPENELSSEISEACSTITNILGTIEKCRERIVEGIMGLIDKELVESLYLDTCDELDILSTHSSIEDFLIFDYKISPIKEDMLSCITSGNVLARLQYGSDGDQRRGDGMVSSIELPFVAEFTCRLCENGIIDYEVVESSISIDTEPFSVLDAENAFS